VFCCCIFFFSAPLLFANITPLFVLDLFVVTVCSPYSTSHTSSNYLLHPRLLTPPLFYVLLGIFYISLVALPFLLYIPNLLHASHILLIHPYIFVSHFYPFFLIPPFFILFYFIFLLFLPFFSLSFLSLKKIKKRQNI